MRFIALILLLAVAGCANISPQSRRQNADRLAAGAGWQKLPLAAGSFVFTAYVPGHVPQDETLTVYIEGDGLAWLSRSRASDDPTPVNPVGLKLALRHPQGAAAYLARPCQYVEPGDARNCRQEYWTYRRFSPEVIESGNQAITLLMRRSSSKKLVLVGYSGGGAVAALLAVRRNDVAMLVTVAGNLDHRAWTEEHRVSPLDGSLNPADEWRSLMNVPQTHFTGARDMVVGTRVFDAYASHFPASHRPEVMIVPDFDHACCWADKWPELLQGTRKSR